MHKTVRGNWLRYCLPLGQVTVRWVSTTVDHIDETTVGISAPSDGERSASLSLESQIRRTDRTSGADAASEQVAAGWDAGKSGLDLAAMGHRAFEGSTQLRITGNEVSHPVSGKLAPMETVLAGRSEFTASDTSPARAQIATPRALATALDVASWRVV